MLLNQRVSGDAANHSRSFDHPSPRSLDGDCQGLPLPDEDDKALAARHPRVDQVPLQHRVMLSAERITTAGYSEPWLLWMVVA